MASGEAWTIRRLLTWTTDYLRQHRSETPRLDAELLLAAAEGCERIALYTRMDDELGDAVRQKFRESVRQRAAGVPVAYLLGRREFFSLSFRVSPEVLIPRPETEFAVLAVLDRLKERTPAQQPPLVCDVGTGSGCIAIAVARHAPQAVLTAIDISAGALAVAQENAETHRVADHITFLQSDLLSDVPPETRFDLIVSNPPYISEAELAELSPEVRAHEPHLALLGGPAGTEIIDRLASSAAGFLVPGGWLIMEISPMIAAAVNEILAADPRWEPALITKDLAGLKRIVQVRRRS